MDKVYLACYYGQADKLYHRICDSITKFFTRGKYSHCEIAIALPNGYYECYTSSYRDGGVRCKIMDLPSDKWELIILDGLHKDDIETYFDATKRADYDLLGALGCVLGFRQSDRKFFCSEWCYNAIFGSNQGWRFNPTQLLLIVKGIYKYKGG